VTYQKPAIEERVSVVGQLHRGSGNYSNNFFSFRPR